MKQQLTTPPAYYPLILEQVKDHLHIDFDDNDRHIQSLIATATAKAEQYLHRRLITQTWKIWLDEWPKTNYIELPFGNLASVAQVYYTDTDYTKNTFSTDYYNVDISSDPGRIVLEYGDTWPTETLSPENPIEIEFTCGYGANAVQTITGATNASPIVLTINTHGRTTGDQVYIYDVGGNTAADGTWIVTKVNDNTFSLNGSSGNAVYTSGGSCIAQSVPDMILHAMRIIISDLYENRETEYFVPNFTKLKTVENLLLPYKLFGAM